MTRRWTAGLVAAAVALGAAGCGDDDGSTASDAPASPTVTPSSAPLTTNDVTTTAASPDDVELYTVEAANGTVTLDGRPERIVVLSPTHTEMLFAIGAGPQVIAVDSQSNYPPESEAVLTELSSFEPSVESIAGYEPDLVVIADDFTGLGDPLAALGIPVWSGPAAETIDDAYAQLDQLGALTGNVADAAEVVSQMQSEIMDLQSTAPLFETPLRYFHEVDASLFSATSSTFIGEVYSLFSLRNIADTAESASVYPQLSPEFVISSNPDLIFLADASYGESPETVAARPGWDAITAVQDGSMIPVDADLASRWGPRIVDYVRVVSDALNAYADAHAVG